jgi:hypothetical protein
MERIVNIEKTPTTGEAEIMIRKLVQAGMIAWTTHCKNRMKERDITMPQIINCLLKGRVTEPPFFVSENGGGYETRVEKGTAGDWLRVAVCMRLDQQLAIITAIN